MTPEIGPRVTPAHGLVIIAPSGCHDGYLFVLLLHSLLHCIKGKMLFFFDAFTAAHGHGAQVPGAGPRALDRRPRRCERRPRQVAAGPRERQRRGQHLRSVPAHRQGLRANKHYTLLIRVPVSWHPGPLAPRWLRLSWSEQCCGEAFGVSRAECSL